MTNFKQEELIEELLDYVREKFPEVELINIAESPEDSESLWVRVTAPEHDDRELALIKYSSKKSTDILMDYGYHMVVMPVNRRYAYL